MVTVKKHSSVPSLVFFHVFDLMSGTELYANLSRQLISQLRVLLLAL